MKIELKRSLNLKDRYNQSISKSFDFAFKARTFQKLFAVLSCPERYKIGWFDKWFKIGFDSDFKIGWFR